MKINRLNLIVIVYFILGFGHVHSQPIIADHTIVDDYDIIPQQYIDSVKKMWVVVAGESHSGGYRIGAELLGSIDPRFQVNTQDFGEPEAATNTHLRLSRGTWGDINQNSGWVYYYGEEDWFTTDLAVERTKAGLEYSNTNGSAIGALGFGWCWDMNWNEPAGGIDPIYQVRWAGTSEGGADGDKVWGLDRGDSILTGNRVNMDMYLNATDEYIQFCEANGFQTKVFFTTGPVDNTYGYNDEEQGFQRHIKMEYIRDYVKAQQHGYLFDYADILCWSDSDEFSSTEWEDYSGTNQVYPIIHPDNMLDLDGGFEYDGDHIGERGSLRIAKAMWWMLARMAGWDGLPEGHIDEDPPSVPTGLEVDILSSKEAVLSWIPSVDNYGVEGYIILKDGEEIDTVIATSFHDTVLNSESNVTYQLAAFDEANNMSQLSESLILSMQDHFVTFHKDFVNGYNWFSVNVCMEDMSIESVFPQTMNDGDYIKNQVASSTYYDGVGWFGTLNEIDPAKMHMIRLQENYSLNFEGIPINSKFTGISLVPGWNWIGPINQEQMSLEEALASINKHELDYLKDQTQSATYYPAYGWFGTLSSFMPGNGYMMRVAQADTITYSALYQHIDTRSDFVKKRLTSTFNNYHQFEFNGSLTARIILNGSIVGSENDFLFAYSGDELRGVIGGCFFEPTDEYLFPLMIHGNLSQGDSIQFRYYDASTKNIYSSNPLIEFIPDMVLGDAFHTLDIELLSEPSRLFGTEITEYKRGIRIYPNPFDDRIYISGGHLTAENTTVKFYTLSGILIKEFHSFNNSDQDIISLQTTDLISGIYIVQVEMRGKREFFKVAKEN